MRHQGSDTDFCTLNCCEYQCPQFLVEVIKASKAIKPIINASAQTFLGQHNLKEPWLSLEVLRKNLYEVNYEVNNRPQMAYVAINGLSDLLQKTSKSKTNSNNISR